MLITSVNVCLVFNVLLPAMMKEWNWYSEIILHFLDSYKTEQKDLGYPVPLRESTFSLCPHLRVHYGSACNFQWLISLDLCYVLCF